MHPHEIWPYLQVCNFANIKIDNYASMLVFKDVSLQGSMYESMPVCKNTGLQVCIYKGMHFLTCKYASMQVII